MLKWGSFVKEKNGEWNGLNNAAIYSFNSNIINSFVREMFQNSIDARDKELPRDPKSGKLPPLRIRINYKEIDKNEFPDFDGFHHIFKLISKSSPNKKHKKFFRNAFSALRSNEKISLFIFEDFNTSGLSGKDDDPSGTFNACVVSEGISIKSDSTSGGSFGIGKNAIYGLSKLRTVFYSSLNSKGDYIFQGKAKLASYYDENRKTKDNKIYCGRGKEFSSIRELSELPEKFRQLFTRKEAGLSQYAMFPVEHEEWPSEFLKAILRNYWLLLDKEELIVELCKQDKILYRISKDNLEKLLHDFFNPNEYKPDDVKPEGNPYEYYKCYKEGNCISNENFPYLKKVRFFYKELDNKHTNAVAYLRNDMVVYSDKVYGYGSINYCGVFICDEDDGNEILSAMEPPTHDSFSAERLDDKHENYSAKDGKKILDEIKNLLKEGLQKIKDKYTQPAEDIDWLDNLLSSLSGMDGNGKGKRKNKIATKETTEKIGKNVEKTVAFGSQKRNTVINDKTGKLEGTGSGGKRQKQPIPGPKPGPKPGPEPGPDPGSKDKKATLVHSRIFKTPNRKMIDGIIHNIYKVLLQAEKEFTTDFVVSQKGDTGNVAMFEISEAKSSDGTSLSFTEELNSKGEIIGYRIKSVTVPANLQIYVNEPYKSSFQVINS